MKILLTGANGFIAREIATHLAQSGHHIIACAHGRVFDFMPYESSFRMDFARALTPEDWLPHLKGIDAVVNCVGVFQTLRKKTMWRIHYESPKSLFDACVKAGVQKIVHISALGVDKVSVPYANSKLAIEKYLETCPVDSTVIRPGLVYGSGSYGGTSLFRGLAGFPWVLPLPGSATTLQQPIHIDDLVCIVEKALTLRQQPILHAVGHEKMSVKALLIALRSWLGFGKAWIMPIPLILIRAGALVGRLIPNSPLGETGVKMMMADNTATDTQEKNMIAAVGFRPRGFLEGLRGMVSSVQDRWHARLYFIRPLLRLTLAFLWIWSGVATALFSTQEGFFLLTVAGTPTALQPFLLYGACALNVTLGMATLLNYRLLLTGTLQIVCMILYTAIITFRLPGLWLTPFEPVAKNIPLLAAILAMMALASER